MRVYGDKEKQFNVDRYPLAYVLHIKISEKNKSSSPAADVRHTQYPLAPCTGQ